MVQLTKSHLFTVFLWLNKRNTQQVSDDFLEHFSLGRRRMKVCHFVVGWDCSLFIGNFPFTKIVRISCWYCFLIFDKECWFIWFCDLDVVIKCWCQGNNGSVRNMKHALWVGWSIWVYFGFVTLKIRNHLRISLLCHIESSHVQTILSDVIGCNLDFP